MGMRPGGPSSQSGERPLEVMDLMELVALSAGLDDREEAA